ncbi:MAG: hypothetical protein V7751_11520 [Pseudoalteromonas distincta]
MKVINLPSEDEVLGPQSLNHIFIIEAPFQPPMSEDSHREELNCAKAGEAPPIGMGQYGPYVAAAAAASIAVPFVIPIGLIAAAIGASAISPIFIHLLAKNTASTEEERKKIEAAQREEALRLSSYMKKHSVTPAQAEKAGYCFEPGHPLVGRIYKRHPLATIATSTKHNLFIPSERYDQTLLAEREAELITMLVDLGAVKISISKKATRASRDSNTISAGADLGGLGGTSGSVNVSSSRNNGTLDTREFRLKGKLWNEGDKIDPKKYFWLAFEPAWSAVVNAREVGGCLAASLEIRETTSFSEDRSVELAVKAQMAEANVSVRKTMDNEEESEYFVSIEFAHPAAL